MKKLTVVIPAYNEERTLAQVLQRVQAVNLEPLQKEIIVVDNFSADRTAEIVAREPRAKLFASLYRKSLARLFQLSFRQLFAALFGSLLDLKYGEL